MPHPALPRRARLLPLAVDLLFGVAFLLPTFLASVLWMLVRTSWGQDDLDGRDATVAFAAVTAALPAWLAWLAVSVVEHQATPGQRRAEVRVVGSATRQLARLVASPRGIGGWLWLAGLGAIVGQWPLAAAFAGVALTVTLVALGTALVVVVRPGTPTLHDRLAGTRVEPRPDSRQR